MAQEQKYVLIISGQFEIILKKLKQKKPDVLLLLEKKVIKVLREPVLGKPLKNTLRNYRRVHWDCFLLCREV